MTNERRYSTTPRSEVRTRANDYIRMDLKRQQYMVLRNDAVRAGNWLDMQALTFVLDETYDSVGTGR